MGGEETEREQMLVRPSSFPPSLLHLERLHEAPSGFGHALERDGAIEVVHAADDVRKARVEAGGREGEREGGREGGVW